MLGLYSYNVKLTTCDRCQGRTDCSLTATDETFGVSDPCPDTGKYLEIIYLCVPGKAHIPEPGDIRSQEDL